MQQVPGENTLKMVALVDHFPDEFETLDPALHLEPLLKKLHELAGIELTTPKQLRQTVLLLETYGMIELQFVDEAKTAFYVKKTEKFKEVEKAIREHTSQ